MYSQMRARLDVNSFKYKTLSVYIFLNDIAFNSLLLLKKVIFLISLYISTKKSLLNFESQLFFGSYTEIISI